MDTLRAMKIFVAVAESGSFTAAAQRVDVSTAYVSRCIAELETHLRTRLLNRTTRRIALTEVGTAYLNRCHEVFGLIAEAEVEASEAHEMPAGTLRIHAMASIGQNYVVPAVAAYQKRYPDVVVDLTLSQDVPDLVENGYDAAIRVSPDPLPDSNYISRKLGTVHSVLCASPAYLAEHGTPTTIDGLAAHPCLQVALSTFPSDRWRLIGPDGTRDFLLNERRFKVNVPDALAMALQEGMGIGALPTLAARSLLRAGTLVRVLPAYRLQHLHIWVVYASRRFLEAKIKSWVAVADQSIGNALAEDRRHFGGPADSEGAPAHP